MVMVVAVHSYIASGYQEKGRIRRENAWLGTQAESEKENLKETRPKAYLSSLFFFVFCV